MARLKQLTLLSATCILVGCTTFSAHRVHLDTDPAEYVDGILVPDQVPLLVIANGQVSTIMVQSIDRATAIQFGAFLAKHDVTLEFFENGGLSKITSNQDSTAVPLKLFDIAGSLAEHVIPAGQGLSGTQQGATSLQVYRIIFRDGEIVGLQPLLDDKNFPPLRLEYDANVLDTPIEDINRKIPPPENAGK